LLKRNAADSSSLPQTIQSAETTLLCAAFNTPDHFFAPLARRSSGFFGAQEKVYGESIGVYQTWFRFLVKRPRIKPAYAAGRSHALLAAKDFYHWVEIAFFTEWHANKSATVLCFGVPNELRAEMQLSLQKGEQTAVTQSPFDAHAFILPFVVHAYDTSVWLWRDWVRELELKRQDNANSRSAFLSMHELARHTIHSTETLTTSLAVVRSMIEEQRDRRPLIEPESSSNARTSRALHHQRTLLECLLNRSKALERRLQNEINLVRRMRSEGQETSELIGLAGV
jgi:hypothetical protein